MNTFTKPTVGQEIAYSAYTGGYEPRYSFGWIVTKVTPSGRFTAQRGDDATYARHFNTQGYEVKSLVSGTLRTCGGAARTDVTELKARAAQRDQARAAAAAILAVKVTECRHTYGKDYMLEQVAQLEALVAAARAAVEAI